MFPTIEIFVGKPTRFPRLFAYREARDGIDEKNVEWIARCPQKEEKTSEGKMAPGRVGKHSRLATRREITTRPYLARNRD